VAEAGSPALPTALARKFVLYFAGFWVAVGLALAPLLANAKPGSLLALFPESLRLSLIPFSGLLMGGVALAVQFYQREGTSRARLRRRFGVLIVGTGLAVLALVVLLNLLVVDVPMPAAASTTHVLIGFHRLPTCGCVTPSDVGCLGELGPDDPMAVESCWSRRWSKLTLTIAYLTTIGGLGGLVGLLLLQEASRRAQRRRSPGKRERRASRSAPPAEPPA